MCLWLRPVDFGSQCKAWELDLWNGWNPTLWWGRRSEETSVTGPLANVIEHVLGIGALIFAMCFPDVTTHHFDTCSILDGALPWLIHFFIAIYIYKYHGWFLAWSHTALPTQTPQLLGPCAGWVLCNSPLALSWPMLSAEQRDRMFAQLLMFGWKELTIEFYRL